MCTPIVIDTPQVDLSGDGTKKIAGFQNTSDPAGTAAPAAAADTPASNPAPTASAAPRKDTAALAADEGRVFVPGADYPGDVGAGTSGTTAPASGDTKTETPTGADTSGPKTSGTGDPVLDQNTLLINSLTSMAHTFSDNTTSILQAQKDASSALAGGFLDLNQAQKDALTAADQLRINTGQASRKPNYSLSLAKNRRANSSGNSSTMLTGAGGVPTNQLALGRAQLLGGADA